MIGPVGDRVDIVPGEAGALGGVRLQTSLDLNLQTSDSNFGSHERPYKNADTQASLQTIAVRRSGSDVGIFGFIKFLRVYWPGRFENLC